MIRRLAIASALVVSFHAAAAEPIGLTEDEFRMYRQYKSALTDARVQAMKPDKRLPAIAKDAGFKLKEFEAAVSKAEAAGDVRAKCEANLKEIFSTGALAGKVGRLEFDDSAAQGVAYVQWFNEEQEELPVEASYAAARAAEACPVASTITVWAQDKAVPKTRVFQALVSSGSARRINVEKVKDFAVTRYMKLFEKVKSVANGDDP